MTESAVTAVESTGSLAIDDSRAISEETANFLTHGTGLILSIVGAVHLLLLAQQQSDGWQIIGCSIYGTTLVALYAASTLSHSFERQGLRQFFRMLDQICIFLLIVGSFTPFALTYLRDGWVWYLFLAMWGLALLGIFFKVFFSRLENVTTSTFILLGWMPVTAINQIVIHFPSAALVWVIVGGLCYTIGTVFLSLDEKYRYFHAIWHLFVIAGSVSHYIAVVYYVLP